MSHYYDGNPGVQSDEETIQYFYHKSQLKPTTNASILSKGKVDFGSDLLIRTFLSEHPPGSSKRIISVGCDYGLIGLMIARVSPHHQMAMADMDHRALHLAEKNKKQSQIGNTIITESDDLSQVENEYFDFVLTNPPIRAGKDVVHRIFEETYQKLKNQGKLYVVIQKGQGMSSAKEKMEGIFNNMETVSRSKGYYMLKSRRG